MSMVKHGAFTLLYQVALDVASHLHVQDCWRWGICMG